MVGKRSSQLTMVRPTRCGRRSDAIVSTSGSSGTSERLGVAEHADERDRERQTCSARRLDAHAEIFEGRRAGHRDDAQLLPALSAKKTAPAATRTAGGGIGTQPTINGFAGGEKSALAAIFPAASMSSTVACGGFEFFLRT